MAHRAYGPGEADCAAQVDVRTGGPDHEVDLPRFHDAPVFGAGERGAVGVEAEDHAGGLAGFEGDAREAGELGHRAHDLGDSGAACDPAANPLWQR